MPTQTIQPGFNNQRSPLLSQSNQATRAGTNERQNFAALLDTQVLAAVASRSDQDSSPTIAALPTAMASTNSGPNGLLALDPLDTLGQKTPSISPSLTENTAYQHESLDLLLAKASKYKPISTTEHLRYASLQPPSPNLLWADSQSQPRSTESSALTEKKCTPGDIPLGTIGGDTPTISHLLKNHPQYRDKAWKIIFSAVNRNKPYTSLRPGCRVSIDPNTLELSLQHNDRATANPAAIASKHGGTPQDFLEEDICDPNQRQFSLKLAASVKSYLGQPYHKIDCYGLVVKGLQDQGVNYSGRGGLLSSLERKAVEDGKPRNAYQNGEGLIEIAGNKLFDKSFSRVKDAKLQAAELMEQLKPLLQEGMLLSFSTPSKGHTGVVAKKDGQWTYVNSGMIDHQINGGKISKRVGEEKLEEEIKNWFLLAKKRNTSLKVSAGLFNTQKLVPKANMMANGSGVQQAGVQESRS